MFRRKKRWILAWITVSGITSVLWGFGKQFQPQWQAEEIRKDAETFFAANQTAAMEEGLKVSLEDRTVRELFRKKTLLRSRKTKAKTVLPKEAILFLPTQPYRFEEPLHFSFFYSSGV